MAIGRITGSMLHSNLVRNGVDLAFETNILYLDVTNQRVAIGHTSPETALHVNGTTTTTGLVAGGLTYPTADGSNGQVLTTNGAGTLSFVSPSAFGSMTFVGDDSTGSTINTSETLKFTGGNNISTSVVNDVVTITGSTNINVNEISSSDSSAIQINDAINVSGNITLPKETNASVIADTFITRNAHIEAATTAVVNLTVTVGSKPADGKWFGQGSTACYYINGVAAPYIDIQHGKIYRFNQSAASNSSHPINIYYDEYKSRAFPDFAGSSSYVTQVGTAGTSGAYTELYVDFPSRGRLSYQCQNHAFMGSFLVVKGSGDPIQFVSDDSSGFYVGGNETIKIAGGNSIDTSSTQGATDTITIALSNAITINEISSSDSTAIQINDALNVAGQINVQGNLIRGLATPIAASDAATKDYVDSGVAGLGPGTVLEITAGAGLTASPTNPITSTGTIALDFSTIVARVVGDDSTGTDLRVGETVKIAGSNNITTSVSGDILTITGSTDINVNSIASADSSAIQINDAVNISGTLNAKTIVTNDLISEDSTAINILDGLNVSGTLSADVLDVNEISSSDSTAIQINNALNVTGNINLQGNTVTGLATPIDQSDAATKEYVDSQIGSSNTLTIADDTSTTGSIQLDNTLLILGGNNITTSMSGNTLTISGDKSIDINEISSSDSTAIQINDAVNVSGTLTTSGLVANGITYPTTDGSPNQVLVTNGSGTLSFTSLTSFAGITFVGDDSTGSTINTAETLKFVGATGITTAVVDDTVTITGPDLSGYAQKTDTAITIVGDDSSGTAVTIGETFKIAGGTGITTSVSGDTITINGANQAQGLIFVGDDSTGTQINDGETFKIAGGNNITTAVSGDVVTINGSTSINVNEISSADSSAIQINDAVNVSGTLSADVLDVNEISSSDSTAIQINDALNVAGQINVQGNLIRGLATPIAASDAATKEYVDDQIVAAGSGTVVSITAGAGLTASPSNPITTTGTISLAKIIDVNEISSSDSSAIQINDAVNIAGILNVSGNLISNVSDPVANQDAATKNYVDTQLSNVSTSFYVEDDTSTVATIDSGDTLRIIGSGGITTAVSGDTLTIVGSNPAQGITFFDDTSTSTAIPDGGTLQITSGEGISTSILGNVITITNTSTQLEIDGGSAYSIYNAISEALIDGGTA